ncbi:hypothetical protein PAXRUDRAFT_403466 [Paxillus rubicundulus Ve08.2h10]|uniref:Uncharacterized protein n=1 Tax=Paxillus rubicundulus Ve08.2h10 TaxID=930991 RepID=A0A0D0EA27_9AGAM|nr:hypothetical protein PAXRUDRAFT_403466 [Paxillus rubicundulus Ve08.2h10]
MEARKALLTAVFAPLPRCEKANPHSEMTQISEALSPKATWGTVGVRPGLPGPVLVRLEPGELGGAVSA